jgi:sortase A
MFVTFKKTSFVMLIIALPLSGMWFIGQGTYIHAKAILAQFLLEAAWVETLNGDKEVKPWSWADTWPICRLDVPALGISRIVLAGAGGSSLAFGPGHLFGSAIPGTRGNSVITGHRDTHFRFLDDLAIGHRLDMQTITGAVEHYEITMIMIVHESETYLLEDTDMSTITLIACYPFDAIQPGDPLRYVVVAKPEKILNLPALTHRESSRLRRDTLRSASCRQSRNWPHTWPARYRAGIASIPVLMHGDLFRDKVRNSLC